MSKSTMFERQLLAQAVAALETTGLVMVRADMAGAVATIFEADHPRMRAEYGTVRGGEQHSPSKVYDAMMYDPNEVCWVRAAQVIKTEMVEREGVEVENDQHFRELLAQYRREGLGWADELALYSYVFRAPDDTLFFELNQQERDRYWALYETIETRDEQGRS